jgi:hypothetical protein
MTYKGWEGIISRPGGDYFKARRGFKIGNSTNPRALENLTVNVDPNCYEEARY